MANAWQTHGKRMANAWQTHGKRKEAHEEKTEDRYHGHAGDEFHEMIFLSRLSSTHNINGIWLLSGLLHASEKRGLTAEDSLYFSWLNL